LLHRPFSELAIATRLPGSGRGSFTLIPNLPKPSSRLRERMFLIVVQNPGVIILPVIQNPKNVDVALGCADSSNHRRKAIAAPCRPKLTPAAKSSNSFSSKTCVSHGLVDTFAAFLQIPAPPLQHLHRRNFARVPGHNGDIKMVPTVEGPREETRRVLKKTPCRRPSPDKFSEIHVPVATRLPTCLGARRSHSRLAVALRNDGICSPKIATFPAFQRQLAQFFDCYRVPHPASSASTNSHFFHFCHI